eukprot:GHVU01177549.1.p1 GENE.GHVU01177549.1~~GHVU01177549.1.p1  ORF type:complete len:131 (+),score=50.71 GHVU01177549.1:224-616(+)
MMMTVGELEEEEMRSRLQEAALAFVGEAGEVGASFDEYLRDERHQRTFAAQFDPIATLYRHLRRKQRSQQETAMGDYGDDDLLGGESESEEEEEEAEADGSSEFTASRDAALAAAVKLRRRCIEVLTVSE